MMGFYAASVENIPGKGGNVNSESLFLFPKMFTPNNKTLESSKLKKFADSKVESCFMNDRKHCGKWRKCWLLSFYPFSPIIFLKASLSEW